MTLLHTLAIQLDISEACSCSFLTNLYAMDLGVMLLLLYILTNLYVIGTVYIVDFEIFDRKRKKILKKKIKKRVCDKYGVCKKCRTHQDTRTALLSAVNTLYISLPHTVFGPKSGV